MELNAAVLKQLVPPTNASVYTALQCIKYEGIVWHHPDGRMAKIKRRNFGLPWPIPE